MVRQAHYDRSSVRPEPVEGLRGKKEYSMEVIETAENLYVYKQKTYDEIARITGVPVVTIQRWSEKYEWRSQKLAQVKRRVDYRKALYELRDQLLESARSTTNPQAIYGLGHLQRIIESEEKLKPIDELPADPGKATGLSAETLEKIKEEIYGITKTSKN
jgi:transposase